MGICLVYMYGLVIGNYQYLIQDLFFATVAAAFMAATPPSEKLSVERPPSSLMSAAVMLPVAANFLVICAFQVRMRFRGSVGCKERRVGGLCCLVVLAFAASTFPKPDPTKSTTDHRSPHCQCCHGSPGTGGLMRRRAAY